MSKPKYITLDHLRQHSNSTTIAQDVRRETAEENDRAITTSEAYRSAGIDGEAWSELGSQVFGAER